jgi:hypothetical protein
MPKGVETHVDNGFAVVDFFDPSLRGPALAKLLDIGGPSTIETITREGPRRKYRVPEGNAREAGLLDTPSVKLASGDTGAAEALSSASPFGARPDPQTVKGRAYVGQTPKEEVLGNTSVATTVVPGSGTKTPAVPPLHSDVIANVAAATRPWPQGQPNADWKRSELDAYAKQVKGINTSKENSKADVVARIIGTKS